jgi:hypothetical protein
MSGDLQEWADLGAMLAAESGEVFAEALEIVRELVAHAAARNAAKWQDDRVSDALS